MLYSKLRPAWLQSEKLSQKDKKEECVTVPKQAGSRGESPGSMGSRRLREGGAEPFTVADSEGQAR